jgi:hypothetical protein
MLILAPVTRARGRGHLRQEWKGVEPEPYFIAGG